MADNIELWTATAAEQKLLEHLASAKKFADYEVLGAVCVDDIVYAVVRNSHGGEAFYDVVVWHTRAPGLPSTGPDFGLRAEQPDYLEDGDVLYKVAQGIYVEPVCGVVVELPQESTPVLTVHKSTVTTVILNSGDRELHKFVYKEDD